MKTLPLMNIWEALQQLPWLSLGKFPTPVQRLHHFPHDNLWIKRDDLSSDVYGCNKVRKLEFTLAEAKALNKSKVVTMGALAPTMDWQPLCLPEAGVSCRLLLFYQPQPCM